MQNKQQKLKKQRLKFQHTDKKSLIIGTIVATIIGATPYLFYLYESVPNTKTWNTFLFTYNSGYYEDVNVAMWILTGKLIPLILLFLWFFTCKHWWHHVLIVPIAMYMYQLLNTLNEDQKYIDSNQLVYLIPVMAIIIPSIYLIRARIFNRINDVSMTLEELENELTSNPKSFWGKIKNYF